MLRKIFAIAGRTLTITLRDRRALLFMFLAPLVLIFILGTALKGAFAGNTGGAVQVAVVDEDQGTLSQIFRDQVLGGEQARTFFTATALSDLAAARTAVGNGQYVAVIHFPAGYSDAIRQGKAPELEVITDAGRPESAQWVVTVVQNFSQQVLASGADFALLGPKAAQLAAQPPTPVLRSSTFGTKPVAALAYYAIAQGVMFLLMNAIGQARSLTEARNSGTLARMLTTPTGRATLVAGEFLGIWLLLAVQMLGLIVGSRWLFGVHWGDPLGVATLAVVYAFALAGISVAIAAFLKDSGAIGALIGSGGMILGALGGSMMPIMAFGPTMQQLAKITPNNWALTAFQHLMAGGALPSVLASVWVLLAIGLVLGAAGSVRLATR